MIDRNCILKACARNLLVDYGWPAYATFLEKNPGGKLKRAEIKALLETFARNITGLLIR